MPKTKQKKTAVKPPQSKAQFNLFVEPAFVRMLDALGLIESKSRPGVLADHLSGDCLNFIDKCVETGIVTADEFNEVMTLHEGEGIPGVYDAIADLLDLVFRRCPNVMQQLTRPPAAARGPVDHLKIMRITYADGGSGIRVQVGDEAFVAPVVAAMHLAQMVVSVASFGGEPGPDVAEFLAEDHNPRGKSVDFLTEAKIAVALETTPDGDRVCVLYGENSMICFDRQSAVEFAGKLRTSCQTVTA